MGLRSIVDVKIAPGGERVAYAVSQPSVERNAHQTSLFVVAAGGGLPRRVAEGAAIFTPALPAPRLRWTPDGQAVSFLGASAAGPQIFVAPVDGGGVRAITAAADGVFAYEWSRDGSRLAFLSRPAPPPRPVIRASDPEPAPALWVQTPGGTPMRLSAPAEYVDSFSWAPDGSEIVYSAAPRAGFTAPYQTRLHAVASDGAARRTIVDRAGMNTLPQVSPNGELVAFVTTNEQMGLMAPRGLAVVPRAGGGTPAIRAFGLDGAWIGDMVWAADSASLYLLLNEGTFATGAHMFEMPVVRIDVVSGKAERVVPGATVNYTLSLSRDGRTLAYRAVEGRTMGDVFVQDTTTGVRRRLTNVNPELAALRLGALTPIAWRSFDGMEIWGLLLTPPGWDRTSRLPMLVYCHGGPIGGVTYGIFPQFAHTVGQVDPYPTEAMASAGYAVLFPMPRGGSGYGEAGHRAIVNDWGGPDYRDIMAGVDHAIAQGIADRDRLGVMGASYGGYMTNWILTQTDRFKAASTGASISDLADMFYLPDGGELMVEYFQRPWENERYRTRSPLTHVAGVKTPVLIQHGERDPRVPLASALKFYRALKGMGKTAEFDLYPRGGHVLYEPAQQRESMRRNLVWFEQWIPH
jgi:dipeptidyl aminopeptidase/acylaminoacyl peptidase